MERTISVRSDRNIWDYLEGGPLWPVLTGLIISVVWTECIFPFDKIVVPSASLLYPAHKNNNQTRSGLGRVFITGKYRSIGHVGRHVEFPKFLLNEKRPMAAYENESIWSGVLPCPTIMTIVRRAPAIVLFCDDLQKSVKRMFDCILYFGGRTTAGDRTNLKQS